MTHFACNRKLAAQNISFGQLADAHGKAAEQLAQTDVENEALLALWNSEDGKVAAQLLDEIASSDKAMWDSGT